MNSITSPGDNNLRITQRKPVACKECGRRKIKCDKKVPCARCQKLGKECTREIVRVSNASSTHRAELEFLSRIKNHLETYGDVEKATEEIGKRISTLEHGWEDIKDVGSHQRSSNSAPELHEVDDVFPSNLGSIPPRLHTTTSDAISIADPIPESFGKTGNSSGEHAALATAVEWLAWGRQYGACFPHRRCRCRRHRRPSEIISISSEPLSPDQCIKPPLSSLLPPVEAARKIVHFHVEHILWHHNAFHAPTFLEQCETFWSFGVCSHPLWVSLYLSVLTTSIWCALNTRKYTYSLGLELNESLVKDLYIRMVAILYDENFHENASLYSIQAIVISTRVAHNLGFSNQNSSLLGACVRVAYSMGLHRISESPKAEISTLEEWHEAIERETGKRVWYQLVIQDHFSIPFTDTYLICPSQYSTALPMNVDDHDLIQREPSTPTICSFVRILAQIAQLIPPLVDGLGPVNRLRPLQEQYQHVIKIDRDMRQLVGNIPAFLLRNSGSAVDDSEAAPHHWLKIARRSLAITAADKIIMIHRPILFYAFQDPAFNYTRQTCIAAALTILREHEQIDPEEDVTIWTHTAFCVTAASVLGLELLFRRGHTDEKAVLYRTSLASAGTRLLDRKGDIMAQRGANLISIMLKAEEEAVIQAMRSSVVLNGTSGGLSTASEQGVDFLHLKEMFIALDMDVSLSEVLPTVAQIHGNEPIMADGGFDLWFSQVFDRN